MGDAGRSEKVHAKPEQMNPAPLRGTGFSFYAGDPGAGLVPAQLMSTATWRWSETRTGVRSAGGRAVRQARGLRAGGSHGAGSGLTLRYFSVNDARMMAETR